MTLFALYPGFLLAGGLLATIPLGLHFFSRRPPDREPLPTARFLFEDTPTLVRPQRVPTDLLLLAVRIGLALAIGAALAGLHWAPARSGAGTVVLVDAGADTLWTWDDAARAAVSEEGEDIVFLAYGTDDGPRLAEDRELSSPQRGTAVASMEEGLRALRAYALSEATWDTLSVIWHLRPTWDRWTPGFGLMREDLWPSEITVASPQDPIPWEEGRPVEELSEAVWVAPWGEGTALALNREQNDRTSAERVDPIRAALGALGHALVNDPSQATFHFSSREEETVDPMGSTTPSEATRVVWHGASPGTVTLRTGLTIGYPREFGTPPPPPGDYERVLAVDERGVPVAWTQGSDRCSVEMGADLRAPALATDPNYPALVRALVEGCKERPDLDHPLSADSRTALARPDLPAHVIVSDLVSETESGRPLAPWLIFLALAFLAAEVGLTRGRTPEPTP